MSAPAGAERELALRKYFRPPPPPLDTPAAERRLTIGGALVLIGIFFLFVGSSGGQVILFSVFGVAGAVLAYQAWTERGAAKARHREALRMAYPQPTDEEVDRWFQGALRRLENQSLEALEITREQCAGVDDLPPITAPVVRAVHGVPPEDVAYRTGRDGIARFSVWTIAFLWLAEDHVGIYHCDYNLLRDAVVNEQTHEYFYRDVVSVVTREKASAIRLPTGRSLTSQQEFEIAVSNNRYFTVAVGSSQLKELTGAETIPDNGTARAIRVLRAKLRESKAAPLASS